MNTQELIIRSIKIVDIAYITIIYVTITILFSVYLDKLIGKFNKKENDKKSTIKIIFEIYANFIVIAIFGYIIRNIVELFPFPLDGSNGFEHSKIKELNGGLIVGFAIFFYQTNLRNKIDYLFNERIFNK